MFHSLPTLLPRIFREGRAYPIARTHYVYKAVCISESIGEGKENKQQKKRIEGLPDVSNQGRSLTSPDESVKGLYY